MIVAIGTPSFIQSVKEISRPYVSCMKPTNIMFGAVPTKVDIPPIDAAYAIPNRSEISKFLLSV